MKKLLSIILVICMLSSAVYILPTTASAADTSGTCGDNLTWNYDVDTATLTISGTGDMYDYSGGVAPWKDYRSQLKVLNIGNEVTSIGTHAFVYCSNLNDVVLPKSVNRIGAGAFASSSLKTIALSESITVIDSGVFQGCELDSIIIPNSVQKICYQAFTYCRNLHSITLSNSVEYIDGSAFAECYNLRDIYFFGTQNEWEKISKESSGTYLTTHTTLHLYCENNSHNYSEVERNDKTCTDDGYVVYTCSKCGAGYTETLLAGHEVERNETWVSCDEGGMFIEKCTLCGKTFSAGMLSPGHAIETETVEPTCTTDGFERTYCSRCEEEFERTILPGGHTYVTTKTEPTCTENGIEIVSCCVCDEVFSEIVIEALGHDIKDTVVEKTCTTDGYTLHECQRCEYTETDNIVKAGHEIKHSEIAATCTKDGMYYEQCTVCGEFIGSGIIPAAHKYVEAVCTVCGDVLHGDSNFDGVVNAMDVNVLLKHLNGMSILDEARSAIADLNNDGFVNAIDANLMKRMLAGKN